MDELFDQSDIYNDNMEENDGLRRHLDSPTVREVAVSELDSGDEGANAPNETNDGDSEIGSQEFDREVFKNDLVNELKVFCPTKFLLD